MLSETFVEFRTTPAISRDFIVIPIPNRNIEPDEACIGYEAKPAEGETVFTDAVPALWPARPLGSGLPAEPCRQQATEGW